MGRVREFDPQAPKGVLLSTLSWTARRRPVTWFLVNVGNKIDPYLMRATGGRLKTTVTAPTVLLTHTGAKSGKKRTTPLAYFTDDDDVVLIASRGGHRDHPAWYHNVVANPEVELWTKGGGGRYRAREATRKERERLWALATGFYPGFARYQERAGDRRIPVIVCSPQD
ncbi:MAG: nitroreductase family deazaflavin-dependent oxidoreductase [Solirubrobacterales bacterium]